MAASARITQVDYGNEVSSSNFRGIDLSGANFDAQETLVDALQTAIDGVAIGTIFAGRIEASTFSGPKTLPASPNAQRETKWLVSMVDAVIGSPLTVEIPCADLSLLVANTDKMDITAGAGLALVTAIEAYHKSVAGNAVSVVEVRHVGRNT